MSITEKNKTKEGKKGMSLEEATSYLKKIGEWESVVKLDRQTIIDWAEFLAKKGTK